MSSLSPMAGIASRKKPRPIITSFPTHSRHRREGKPSRTMTNTKKMNMKRMENPTLFSPKFAAPMKKKSFNKFKLNNQFSTKPIPTSRLMMTKEKRKMTTVIGQSSPTYKKKKKKNKTPAIVDPSTAAKATNRTKFIMRNEDSRGGDSSSSETDDETEEEIDLTSLLCLVPLVVLQGKEEDTSASATNISKTPNSICYWPCLVFSGLDRNDRAMKCHGILYPKQEKLQKRLRKKFLKSVKAPTTSDKNNDDNRVVVLPLRDESGCCPLEVCKKEDRLLYNVVGKDVVRFLDDSSNNDGKYLKEMKKMIPVVPALKSALIETERLLSLDDDEIDENISFPPSRKRHRNNYDTLAEDHEQERPVKFRRHKSRGKYSKNKSKDTSRSSSSTGKATGNSTDDGMVLVAGKDGEENPRRSDEATTTTTNEMKNEETTTNQLRIEKTTQIKKYDTTMTPSVTSANKEKKKVGNWVKRTQDIIVVPSWVDVRPLLKQLGHFFYENDDGDEFYFCRPNGDPRKNKAAKEGEDYFKGNEYHESLQQYRAYLCAHGVEYVDNLPTEKESDKILTWVRFHILHIKTGERDPVTIDEIEFIDNNPKKRGIKILRRIGYKFVDKGLNMGYLLVDAQEKKYLEEDELWEHLGKYRINAAFFDGFESKDEQVATELLVIKLFHGKHGGRVFSKSAVIATENDPANMEERECTPPGNKLALEACNRGPGTAEGQDKQEAMTPRQLLAKEIEKRGSKDDSQRNAVLSASDSVVQDEPTSDAEAKENNYAVDDTDNEFFHSNESNMEDVNKDHESELNSALNWNVDNMEMTRVAASELVINRQLSSREDDTTVVEESFIKEVKLSGSTNEEKLKACVKNLKKNKLVASGQLSKSIARIQSFVDTVIESKGKTGDEFNNFPILYICGAPGSGKTMSTTQICKEAIATRTKNKHEFEKAPRLCYLNCPSLKNFSTKEGIEKALQRMDTTQARLKRSPNDVKKAATILILDEVDQLIGNKGTEGILRQLSNWARDKDNVLSVIGISNSVFNSRTNRLQEYGLGVSSNKLVFQTYRKDDLVRMTQSKIGFSVVDKKAHEFIAAKVANSCGDARKYLDLVVKAVRNCICKLSLEKRDTIHTKPIVMIRDAMMAIRETIHKSKEIIESLTSFEKMTLCAGVHLARKLNGKATTFGMLRKLTMEAFGMDCDVSLEEFKGVIERLQDSGVLKLAGTDNRRGLVGIQMSSLVHYPIQFDLQLEDVDSALEEIVMNDDFYKRMVDRVKKM